MGNTLIERAQTPPSSKALHHTVDSPVIDARDGHHWPSHFCSGSGRARAGTYSLPGWHYCSDAVIKAQKSPKIFRPWGLEKLLKLSCLRCGCLVWLDVHAATFAVELHASGDEGEDRVVTTEADIAAWDELRSALAQDDVAWDDDFAAEFLNAETLAYAVATVFDTTLTFFMCHKPELDRD